MIRPREARVVDSTGTQYLVEHAQFSDTEQWMSLPLDCDAKQDVAIDKTDDKDSKPDVAAAVKL
jgi:hypothetical protein